MECVKLPAFRGGNMLFIGPLGGSEVIVILIIVLIIFGPSKLPQMGQALGKAIKEFKKAGQELRSEVTDVNEEKGILMLKTFFGFNNK
jgi:sec-independent protein translocase protein TatA